MESSQDEEAKNCDLGCWTESCSYLAATLALQLKSEDVSSWVCSDHLPWDPEVSLGTSQLENVKLAICLHSCSEARAFERLGPKSARIRNEA